MFNMFNKKVMVALLNVVALLIIVKVIFMSVMFVWMYVGEPAFYVFDPRNSQMQNVVLFIVELGSNGFLYVLLAAIHGIILHKGHQGAAAAAKKSSPSKRRSTRRKSSKKK